MRRPASVSLVVLFTLLVGRTTVCDAERSVHDNVLASLCTPQSPTERAQSEPLPTPTLFQSGASTLQISIAESAAPLALFVTDAEGTVLALDTQRRSNATLTLPFDALSEPQRLVPRALLAEGCTRVEGAGIDNWRAVVEQFDYEAAGGVALGPHVHAHGRGSHNLSEPELASAVPQLEVTADGRTTVRMLQRPSLYVPLVYLRGCRNKLCEAVVYVRRFKRSEWPTAADGARTFQDAAAAAAGWWRDPACTSLFACATMPPVHHHGGLPQRCTELDVRPAIVARLEAAAAAATRPTSSDITPLPVRVSVASGARLRVRAAECDEMRLYLKDRTGSDAAVLAFRAGAELSLALAPPRDGASNATSTPRVVWAYRACGPLTAPAELRRSAPIELAPFLLAANAAAPPAAAGLPGARGASMSHMHGRHDERSSAASHHASVTAAS